MIENWIQATTTSTASPYTLTAVSGSPEPADAFGTDENFAYMIEVTGGTYDGNRESGIAHLTSGGTMVVDTVETSWDGTTYTGKTASSAASAVTKTGATTISVMCFPGGEVIHPAKRWQGVASGIGRALWPPYVYASYNTWSGMYGTANRLYYQPFAIESPVRIDGMHTHVNSGANWRAGFYSDKDGAPFTKLAQTAQQASTPSGDVEVSWESSVVLALRPGMYWSALVADNVAFDTYGFTPVQGMVSQIIGCSAGGYNHPALIRIENVTGMTLPTTAASVIYTWPVRNMYFGINVA